MVVSTTHHPVSPRLNSLLRIFLNPLPWHHDGQIRFLFGTDDLGRDLLSRIIAGSVYSLGYPLLAVVIAALIGIPIGAWAGMSRGVQSSALNHFLD